MVSGKGDSLGGKNLFLCPC